MDSKERKPFYFKQFKIYDDDSTMKVGTDAVLLAAWLQWNGVGRAIDIGCGCGLIAMSVAQRFSQAEVLAIDIDEDSVQQAQSNFEDTKYTQRLRALCIDFKEFADSSPDCFDLLVSNPPFFVNSLKCKQVKRNKARHTDSLPFQYLASGVEKRMADSGKFALILPFAEAEVFLPIARKLGLSLSRRTDVIPREGKEVNRVLMEFRKEMEPLISDTLCIRLADNSYSPEYIQLTRMFLTCFD